jgi:hypothetical protein
MTFLRSLWSQEEGIGHARGGRIPAKPTREEGAILMLALAYLVAVSLVVALLSTWATNDLNNSKTFSSANSLTLAATDMTDAAIQYVRYNPLISTSQLADQSSPVVGCWGPDVSLEDIPDINGDQIAVWCSTIWDPSSEATRTVTFDACPITVSTASCTGTNTTLTAVVQFDDYPPAPTKSAPIQVLCSVWCGTGMTIAQWQWGNSAPGSVTGKAAGVAFISEPSDTTVNAPTSAEALVTDLGGNPVAGDTVSIAQNSGPQSSGPPVTPGIATTTAVTNTQGIATFTNIVPTLPTPNGQPYTLIASDGNVTSSPSSSFTVQAQRATFTPSAAPLNATQGGAKYTPSATQISAGTTVSTALDSSSTGCAMAPATDGVVSFTGTGTCVVDFTDPGNANFSAAIPVKQSFPVGGLAATQVAITLTTATPAASSTTNVGITLTLENATGGTVTSSGTTTVVLTDIESGYFATSLGTPVASGSQSLSVNILAGKSAATASFGDVNQGPDTISAVNGASNWGTASLTIQSGAAAQVAITSSSPSPAVSSLTNTTLTFQLEDQLGNPVTSVGTTTLSLSDAGNGFFAASNGVTGTPTLTVSFVGGTGSATAYFGNETSGSDLITAKNGAAAWGTSTLNLAAGAAASVQITLSPASPTQSTKTNTAVLLQLVDQYGNDVTTTGVSLTLSNSGSGFFDANSGISVMKNGATSTLVLDTKTGDVTGYFGDNTVQPDTITATGPSFAVTTPSFNV